MDDKLQKEHKAMAAYLKLIEDAEACRLLHVEAGLRLPVRLTAMFQPDHRDDGNANSAAAITIPRPTTPRQRPRGATEDWICLPIEEVQETSLVLAGLAPRIPIPASRIVEAVQTLRPGVNKGTLANIGTRLEYENIIQRDDRGWMLIDETYAMERTQEGTPAREHIWGRPKAFQKQELAAYRRLVILHILRSLPDGQQVAQLTRTLETNCPWLSDDIPVTKFLVKTDIEALADRRLVKKIGGSQKWVLSSQSAKAKDQALLTEDNHAAP